MVIYSSASQTLSMHMTHLGSRQDGNSDCIGLDGIEILCFYLQDANAALSGTTLRISAALGFKVNI